MCRVPNGLISWILFEVVSKYVHIFHHPRNKYCGHFEQIFACIVGANDCTTFKQYVLQNSIVSRTKLVIYPSKENHIQFYAQVKNCTANTDVITGI